MHTILLIIEKPTDESYVGDVARWNSLSVEIGKIAKTTKSIDRPADNVLLLPASTLLHQFVSICSKITFPYRCLFLQEEPEWVKYKP